MVQIIPTNPNAGGFKRGLLSGLQQSTPAAVERLLSNKDAAELKAQELKQTQGNAQALSKLLNMPELAEITDPRILSGVSSSGIGAQVKSRGQQELLQSILGGGDEQQNQMQQPSQNMMQGQQNIHEMGNAPPLQMLSQEQMGGLWDRMNQQQKLQFGMAFPQLASQLQKESQQRQDRDLAERKFAAAEKKEGTREKTEAFKLNSDFINNTYNAYDQATERLARLERMRQLNESGELTAPGLANFMNIIGIPIESLQNYSNDEFNKLANDLTAGITQDYGNRILASEFNVMLRRLPTLQNTPEGRSQIMENMKLLLEPARVKKEAIESILDEHEATGKPLPLNLRGAVSKKVKPELDKIYEGFKSRNGRIKVPAGSEVNDNVADKYLELSRDPKTGQFDLGKAAKMMEEDGYTL